MKYKRKWRVLHGGGNKIYKFTCQYKAEARVSYPTKTDKVFHEFGVFYLRDFARKKAAVFLK
jgi:hypothetical protein